MGTSHFNARKVLGRCELCGKAGTEVHHLQHQSKANEKGRIKHFHKNHLANLISLCGECHDQFHDNDVQYERKKTTKGYKLMPVKP
jgi:5-methylcytosine-specific restriction endonuclease McrA